MTVNCVSKILCLCEIDNFKFLRQTLAKLDIKTIREMDLDTELLVMIYCSGEQAKTLTKYGFKLYKEDIKPVTQ